MTVVILLYLYPQLMCDYLYHWRTCTVSSSVTL